MKKALLEVSYVFLEQLLKLPPGVQIAEVFQDVNAFRREELIIKLQGDALPDVFERKEGELIPYAYLIHSAPQETNTIGVYPGT